MRSLTEFRWLVIQIFDFASAKLLLDLALTVLLLDLVLTVILFDLALTVLLFYDLRQHDRLLSLIHGVLDFDEVGMAQMVQISLWIDWLRPHSVCLLHAL